MFDITKRKQFKTVGELKEILRDIPDNTRVYICGEDTDSCWFHVENDGSIVSFDGNDLDLEYCDNPLHVVRAKNEYLKGGSVMTELLRNEEFAGLSRDDKLHLLNWAGEGEYASHIM